MQFVGTRLRPLPGGARFRRQGTASWNDGGIGIGGKHLLKQSRRILYLALGLLVGIGVIIMLILTEYVFVTTASLSVPWSDIMGFGYEPKKALLTLDLGDNELSPVTMSGPIATELTSELRKRMPDREVAVTGTADIGLIIAALVMLGIIVGFVAFSLIRY